MYPSSDKILAFVDNDNNYLGGIDKDGVWDIPHGIPAQVKEQFDALKKTYIYDNSIEGYNWCILNKDGSVALGEKTDGSFHQSGVSEETINYINERIDIQSTNSQYICAVTDANGYVLFGTLKDGTFYAPNGISDSVDTSVGCFISEADTMEFIFCITDNNGYVVFGVRKDGTLFQPSGMPEETKTVLAEHQTKLTELEEKLNSGQFKSPTNWSDSKHLEIPEPRLAYVNLTGITNLPQAKNTNAKGYFEMWDLQGNYFKKEMIIDAQGNSSMAFTKKNFAVDLINNNGWDDEDTFSLKIGDWVPQDSFHFKAYYTDFFRGVCPIAYKICQKIFDTRDLTENRTWKKALIDFDNIGDATSNSEQIDDIQLQIDNGARCFPDGFPCIVYLNGEFYGVYAWQLKKHRDNFHQSKKKSKHIHIDGNLHSYYIWDGIVDWNQFEIRNPKSLVYADYINNASGGYKYDADLKQFEIAGANNIDDIPEYSATANIEIYNKVKVTSGSDVKVYRAMKASYGADINDTAYFKEITSSCTIQSYISGKAYAQNDIVEYDVYNTKKEKSETHYFLSSIDNNTNVPVIDFEDEKNVDDDPDYKNKLGTGWINCTLSVQVKEYITALSKHIGNLVALKDDAVAGKEYFDTYFDANNLIDYIIAITVVADGDSLAKNWQWTTWDGQKWYVNPYDMDGSFGAWHVGLWVSGAASGFYGKNSAIPTGYIYRYYLDELKARFKELVSDGVLVEKTFTDIIWDWCERIGADNYEREYERWPQSPCNRESNLNSDYWSRNSSYMSETWSATKTYAINAYVVYSGRVYKSLIANNFGNNPKEVTSAWEDMYYDETKSYAVGDICYYGFSNKYQFKCKTACTGQVPLFDIYNLYPRDFGHRDSMWRIKNWVKKTLTNLNSAVDKLTTL